jgi:hypothetical protein
MHPQVIHLILSNIKRFHKQLRAQHPLPKITLHFIINSLLVLNATSQPHIIHLIFSNIKRFHKQLRVQHLLPQITMHFIINSLLGSTSSSTNHYALYHQFLVGLECYEKIIYRLLFLKIFMGPITCYTFIRFLFLSSFLIFSWLYFS